MFIDAVHDYETTRRCLDLYIPLVAPEFVVFDDIRINEAMRRFWRELSAEHRDNAIDVTDASHRAAAAICGRENG